MSKHESLLQDFESYSRAANRAESLMQQISDRLHQEMGRYNWVGFYLMEEPGFQALLCGPHAGSFPPTPRIPLDKGLCGAAARSAKSVVVNNVANDPRYIGSDMVKSNMVAPIFAKKRIVAEICVESYFTDTFNAAEQRFIESCAAIVGLYMERTS
jgi:L-methionine (R)-S-oxide reductase